MTLHFKYVYIFFSVLLERVFFRIGSSDTDTYTQLSSCINNFLVPVLQKLSLPHEPAETKYLMDYILIIYICYLFYL